MVNLVYRENDSPTDGFMEHFKTQEDASGRLHELYRELVIDEDPADIEYAVFEDTLFEVKYNSGNKVKVELINPV